MIDSRIVPDEREGISTGEAIAGMIINRPDQKQVIQELMVSQDGGVPFMSKSHDGNASDNNVFRERCAAIVKEFAASEGPRYLIADSKLYTSENAANLGHLPFITRIPGNLKVVGEVIEQLLLMDT